MPANIGGRLIGTSFAWVTATLAVTPDRAYAPTKVALVAAGVGFSVCLVGFIASFFLREPPREELPEQGLYTSGTLRVSTIIAVFPLVDSLRASASDGQVPELRE